MPAEQQEGKKPTATLSATQIETASAELQPADDTCRKSYEAKCSKLFCRATAHTGKRSSLCNYEVTWYPKMNMLHRIHGTSHHAEWRETGSFQK